MKKKTYLLGDKQHYSIEISAYGLSYYIAINDVIIHEEYDPEVQIDAAMPVNHYFRSGPNSLSITIYPEEEGEGFSPGARLSAKLLMTNEDSDTKHTISDISFDGRRKDITRPSEVKINAGKYTFEEGLQPSNNGAISISSVNHKPVVDYQGGAIYTREINLPTSLPLWAFFDSDDLPDIFDMPEKQYYQTIDGILNSVLRKVEHALETGDVDSVMHLFEERNRETDLAFYSPPGTKEKEFREDLLSASKDADLTLSKIGDAQWLNFNNQPSKKIKSLIRGNNLPAIGMDLKDGGSTNYPIVFRYQDGKWIITR